MSFLTLYHTMTGAEMMVQDIADFQRVAKRYQQLVKQWLHKLVYQVNEGRKKRRKRRK